MRLPHSPIAFSTIDDPEGGISQRSMSAAGPSYRSFKSYARKSPM